jgi:hypothetical protein
MPRHGAITFGDLIGQLGSLRVTCSKCDRTGSYRVARLIHDRGRDGKLVDFLSELSADCPKKRALNSNDTCGARFPDLAKVL